MSIKSKNEGFFKRFGLLSFDTESLNYSGLGTAPRKLFQAMRIVQ